MDGKKLYHQRAVEAGLASGEVTFPVLLPAVKIPRFLVRAGTRCAIRKVTEDERKYRPYRTVRDVGVERFETYRRDETGGYYEFRHAGWFLLVHRRNVIHREDTY